MNCSGRDFIRQELKEDIMSLESHLDTLRNRLRKNPNDKGLKIEYDDIGKELERTRKEYSRWH